MCLFGGLVMIAALGFVYLYDCCFGVGCWSDLTVHVVCVWWIGWLFCFGLLDCGLLGFSLVFALRGLFGCIGFGCLGWCLVDG